jgi:hypothetical protein
MKHLITIFVLIFLAGCEPSSFIIVEPTYKRTFSPSERLKEGDEIKVLVEHLLPGEKLEFYKCGEPCNTATNVGSCGHDDLSETNEVTFKVKEDGKYYFWFNSITENTAIPVAKEIVREGAHTIITESGSKITVYPVSRLTSL